METFSSFLAFCAGNPQVTSEFPPQRPVTRSLDVFFDLRLNDRLSIQSRRRWFETQSRALWRHCNVNYQSKQFVRSLQMMQIAGSDTKTVISSFWRNCHHCVPEVSQRQLSMQPVMMILSEWRNSHFGECIYFWEIAVLPINVQSAANVYYCRKWGINIETSPSLWLTRQRSRH